MCRGEVYIREMIYLICESESKKKMGRGRDCVNYVVWVFILYQFI